jgi:hypothetical protein
MTTKTPSRPRSPSQKVRVLRITPTIDKSLTKNCTDVAVKMTRALENARVGATSGAVIVVLDNDGNWSVDLAGKLMHDQDTLFLITGRMFGACLVSK